jgi:hypothetical protein
LTKRRLPAISRFEIRFGWLVLLAFSAQLFVIYVGTGEAETFSRFIFPLSYVLLGAFVVLNWRHAGLLIIGVGLSLNFLAIVANGGLMPASPERLVAAGRADDLAGLELGEPVPNSKNVLLADDDTHLRFLTDRIEVAEESPFPLFSLGDLFIFAGLILTLLEILLSFSQGASRDRPSLT